MLRRAAACLDRLREVLARETLPPPPPGPERPERRGLASLLFSVEPLPLEPVVERRRAPWLSWLFLPERLERGGDEPEVK